MEKKNFLEKMKEDGFTRRDFLKFSTTSIATAG